MDTKSKVKIICGVIGTVGGIISAYVGGTHTGAEQQNEYIQSQIANVNGDNNNITINNVDDIIKQYTKLVEDNEKLEKQNTQYFEENAELKEEQKTNEDKLSGQPEYNFESVGLSIDGEKVAVDTSNSVLIFNGKEYWSKELATKLVTDNKEIKKEDNCIYVGNVITDATNLFDLHINDNNGAWVKDMAGDSYGNTRFNVLISYNSPSGYATFVLKREFKYIKFGIAACDSCRESATMAYVIRADDKIVYTSKSFNKKTEPFNEESIDIGNCNLLTIEFSTDNFGEAFVYDAVVFN